MRKPAQRYPITLRLLKSAEAQPRDKPFEIRDEKLRGLMVRVQPKPSGFRSYVFEYARHKRITLGDVEKMLPEDARDLAARIAGNVAAGLPPRAGFAQHQDGPTLGKFAAEVFEPLTRQGGETPTKAAKNAAANLARITRAFGKLWAVPLAAITAEALEAWKAARLADTKPSTVMRDLTALAGLMRRAVKFGRIESNPVHQVERLRLDKRPAPKFLTDDQEAALRDALAQRDADGVAAIQRNDARQGRAVRKHLYFRDHLTPAVLLSLNTGLRRGELFALRWSDLSADGALLTVRGATAKSETTRHVPLNAEARDVLKRWQRQSEGKGDSPVITTNRAPGEPVASKFKSSFAGVCKAAKIRCTWHQLRHTFASRLVQRGANLNTVRELLGHQALSTTQIYAHLRPGDLADAVAMLNK